MHCHSSRLTETNPALISSQRPGIIMPPDSYAPAGIDRKDPRVSPLYADLSGLPPMLIQVGSAEGLLDAGTAGAADVPVTPEVWPHVIQAWDLWNARLEPGRAALRNAGAFIRRNPRPRD
ncbi:MAG: alpha/beta hydrolase fold domain-containing protein [Rhodomicrobium sp.]